MRYYLIHFVLPIVATVLALIGLEASGLDRAITDYFFDPISNNFYWRYNWFLEVIMHRWTKHIAILIAASIIGAVLFSIWIPSLVKHRRVLVFAAVAMMLAPATVTLLKSQSSKHCPWDLQEYGGYAPYTRLLEPLPPEVKPGRCFPAGHASTGFCLMTFYFIGKYLRRRYLAAAGLIGGLTIGFILGFGRVLQGAHFLSHNVGSAIICWLVMVFLYELLLRRHSLPVTPATVPA